MNDLDKRLQLKKKFKNWAVDPNISINNKLNIEQSSSDITAEFKANYFKNSQVIDMTGGFGIDTYFFSQSSDEIIYIEENIELFEAVMWNFKYLEVKNVSFINMDSIKYLSSLRSRVNLIYCDPSRRNDGKKVFKLEDSEPNITLIFDKIEGLTDKFLLKTSPFLDIKYVQNQLPNINEILLVSVDGELKEILYYFDFKNPDIVSYTAVLLKNNKSQLIKFCNLATTIQYSYPKLYIYEPDSSIMKLGFFAEFASKFNLEKIEVNSHLFTSDALIEDFPGRRFQLEDIVKPDAKFLRKNLIDGKANLTIRNFPDTVASLKIKLKIKDGGNKYLFATRLIDKKYRILICEKI